MTSVYAAIMAGGRGERFWPLSTTDVSKPFLPLLGKQTLIQQAVARLQPLVPSSNILISIGESHQEIARQQLPDLPEQNFIVEPMGRDTSACIGFCALHLERRDPQGLLLAVPADHFVADPEQYRATLQQGIDSLPGANGVVFGVRPSRPETGYGYVRAEKPSAGVAWSVLRFVEKPDADLAVQFLESGDYFWNSGIFLWQNKTLLDLFAQHMPLTYQGLAKLRPLLESPARSEEVKNVFSTLERISIDFGILEKCSKLRLVPVEFAWDDIGNWAALERSMPADEDDNRAHGGHVAVDSNGCIVYSDSGTVATFGVSDLVIVQAHGKVLVCSKKKAPDLKSLVGTLESAGE